MDKIELQERGRKPGRSPELWPHDGREQPLQGWAEEVGIPYPTLFTRIKVLRWPFTKAINTPVKRRRMID